MSATLVVEPVDGGWNVVNVDDFNDSMRNLIDGSFIAAPDEGSDVTDEKALDDFAESIGASGWMTTQEVAADMKNAYVNERFPSYGDDYYLGQWDESDEVDYDGNDAVYFMWGESGKRDNSFEVDITCDPDMFDETGRGYGYTIYSGNMVEDASGYRPEWDIDDAIAAAEKWCETNRDSLSPVERESSKKDKESNMKHRSARKIAHYFDFWGESVNPDGTYEIFWGEDGDMNNSIDLIAKEDDDADTLYCTILGPDGSELDNFTESNWGDAKDEFDRQCTIDHKYEGLLYNDQDPFDTPKGVNEFASIKTSMSGYVWGEEPFGDGCSFYYGPDGDLDDSFNVIVDAIDNTYEYVVYGGNGDILFDKEGFSSVDEAKDAAIAWCQSSDNMTASVKTSMDGSVWGEEPFGDGCSFYYGVDGNTSGSLNVIVDVIDNTYEYVIYGTNGDIITDEEGFFSEDEARNAAIAWCQSFNGTTASVKTSMNENSNGYSFWGDTVDNGSGDYEVFYGENGEENNSVMLYGTPDADEVDCVVVAPDGSTLDSFTADTWDEAKDRFDTDCRINHMYDDYIVDPQNPYSNTMASVKTSMDEDSNGYSFWGEEQTDDGGFSVWYGEPQNPQNSLQIFANLVIMPDGKTIFSVDVHTSDEWYTKVVDELPETSFETVGEVWEALYQYLPAIASKYLEPIGGMNIASVKTSMDGDGFSFWGEMKIDNPMLDNAYQMFYGEPENKNNSLKCQAWQSNDPNDNYESECIIKTPDFNTLDSTVLPSWKECKQWFKDYCLTNAIFIDGILQASSKPEDL